MNWRKSKRSFANGNCAEVANRVGAVLVRDTKDPDGPVLGFSPEAWRVFLRNCRGPESCKSSPPPAAGR